MPSALVIIAQGTEEMEAVITADTLRRAEVDVTIAGLDGSGPVECSRKVKIMPDCALGEVAGKDFDLIVVPGGGEGPQRMCKSDLVGEILKKQESNGRLIGAICAGPTVLAAHKVCVGKTVTSYPHPDFQKKLDDGGYKYSQETVCVDGNLITSRGPATAMLFALQCASSVTGEDQNSKVGKPMLCDV